MLLAKTLFDGLCSVSWLKKVARRTSILLHALQEIKESFLGDIIGLGFINVLGVLGIIIARWFSSVQVEGDENEMGFGQIVPLVLLGLPILAVVEVHSGILLWKPSKSSIIS